jgi:hypothetical protein
VVAFNRPAGSPDWSGPLSVSGPPAYDSGFPSLAANESGQAMVAWKGEDHYGDLRVARAAFRRSDGSWEAPQNLGYSDDESPSDAINARGDAVVVWTRANTVYAESRPAGGTWGPAVVLSQGFASGPTVAMNRRGDALVVWETVVAGSYEAISSFRGAGSTSWTTPSRIAVSEFVAVGVLSFVLDEGGNATVIGVRSNGKVEAVTQAAGAADWSAPVVFGNTGVARRGIARGRESPSTKQATHSWSGVGRSCIQPVGKQVQQAGSIQRLRRTRLPVLARSLSIRMEMRPQRGWLGMRGRTTRSTP